MVVARFPQDDQIYRAKVTAVRNGVDHQTTSYEVLYIDYGNSCQDLSRDDLWSWDPLYEMIQPQAHLCSLKGFPNTRKINPEVFQRVMISQKAMKMHICEVYPFQCGFFKASQSDFGKKIELFVSLITEADKDVCEVLTPHFVPGLEQQRSKSLRERRTANQDKILLESLNAPPVRFVSAPPPHHLQAEQGGIGLSPPPSPIPPLTTVKSVQKVFDWDCSISQDSEVANRKILKRSWRGTQEGKVRQGAVYCIDVSEEILCAGYTVRGCQAQRRRRKLNSTREIFCLLFDISYNGNHLQDKTGE